MRAADFNYCLPPELIAQTPSSERDQSRLLVLCRENGEIVHRRFHDLPEYLRPNDVLVLNNSRVIPARLRGVKPNTGGQIEVLLVEENAINDWWVMLRPGKRVRAGTKIIFFDHKGQATEIYATVLEKNEEGHCRLHFSGTPSIVESLGSLGETPLPPYISRENSIVSADDRERYQTIFARPQGSVAAPTAGLHFTEKLFDEIRALGVRVCFVTLHIGFGTFAAVKSEKLEEHIMHGERFRISGATSDVINEAKREHRRVIAVGTTSVRVLESVSREHNGKLVECEGRTPIFIYPPFRFQIVDAMLTNFHLPQSTLLMLVSAFAAPGETRGRGLILSTYAEAIRERYRFYSFGDAMLIL